jgi:transcriptional regulator with XRE-family HTH domain
MQKTNIRSRHIDRNPMQRQPHPLLDKMMEFYQVDSDKDLADRMEISMGSVSRIRGGTQLVSAQMILKIYDQTFLSIEEIRELIKQTQKQVP